MKSSIILNNIKYRVLFSYEKNSEIYLAYALNEKEEDFTKISVGKIVNNKLVPISDEEDYSMIESLIKKFEIKRSINEKK